LGNMEDAPFLGPLKEKKKFIWGNFYEKFEIFNKGGPVNGQLSP